MHLIVVGCGRYGSLIAENLSAVGHSVVVVDNHEQAFTKLSGDFSGFTITGDASELSVLKKANINSTECLLSMCNQDTLNLMVTQIAKIIFGVPKVIARVYNPCYEPMFRKFDIDLVNPIQLAVASFLEFLNLNTE